jgi:uncharacterized protein DUF4440
MTFNRRNLAFAGAAAVSVAVMGRIAPAAAEGEEGAVKQAVEAFRKAQLASDRAALEKLVADQLSYGHSGGRVENKTQFLDGAAKSRWKAIGVSEETDSVVGSNAVTRFLFTGENESDGKVNAVKIGVLMVWLKQEGNWKLLARQAVKV